MRPGPNIDNLLNTQSALNDPHNTNNRSSNGLQMPQTSPFINQNRGKGGFPSNFIYQRIKSNNVKKTENKSNIFLLTPDQQNQRYGMASQSSLGSREKTPVDVAEAKMKPTDSAQQQMKNLIIIKRAVTNYQMGLNSGTMNFAKEEGGNASKQANIPPQNNFFSMIQSDQKDSQHQESKMKSARMMSSLSPTPMNNSKP